VSCASLASPSRRPRCATSSPRWGCRERRIATGNLGAPSASGWRVDPRLRLHGREGLARLNGLGRGMTTEFLHPTGRSTSSRRQPHEAFAIETNIAHHQYQHGTAPWLARSTSGDSDRGHQTPPELSFDSDNWPGPFKGVALASRRMTPSPANARDSSSARPVALSAFAAALP
jgi:hypothetical protein